MSNQPVWKHWRWRTDDVPGWYTRGRPCRPQLERRRSRGLQTAGCTRPPTHGICRQHSPTLSAAHCKTKRSYHTHHITRRRRFLPRDAVRAGVYASLYACQDLRMFRLSSQTRPHKSKGPTFRKVLFWFWIFSCITVYSYCAHSRYLDVAKKAQHVVNASAKWCTESVYRLDRKYR